MTIEDIDWSCPADLSPYDKAHKLELKEKDSYIHMAVGSYMVSAVLVGIDLALNGRTSKAKYIKNPILAPEEEKKSQYKESAEEIAVYEMKKRAQLLASNGLAQSPD
jgi:hypothetical protein